MTSTQKEKLVAVAKSLIGKPYKYGAKPEEAPHFFDCSSFTQYVFKQVGIELPRNSLQQASDRSGEEISLKHDFSNLEIGDLMFMRGVIGRYNDDLFSGRIFYIGHVGIYLGDQKVISARGGKIDSTVIQSIEELTKEPHYRITLVKRF